MSELDVLAAQNLSKVLSPESLGALAKFLNILVKADKIGLLDTINDLLDESVTAESARALLTTGVFSAMFNFERISSLLESLSKNAEALERGLKIIEALDRLGLLQSLGDLADEEVVGEAARAFLNTGSFYVLNEMPKILDIFAKLRLSHALESAASEVSDGPPPSAVNIVSQLLLDEDVRRGLAFVIKVAREIGVSLRAK